MLKIIAIDPSGNHDSEKEGMGTTGLAYDNEINEISLHEIKASDYPNTCEYWFAVTDFLFQNNPQVVVIEGYKLYNHKGMSAQTQANSTLMTSQLIGAVRMWCHLRGVPCHIQYAADVKTRWSDKVLQAKGYLDEKNRFNGEPTNAHKRDALRHLLHFKKYKQAREIEI